MESVSHYLNNYLVVGCLESAKCDHFLSMLTSQFIRVGLPIASKKLEGPACVLTFFGIDIDTQNMQLWLPHTKLQEL